MLAVMVSSTRLEIATPGRGFTDLTARVDQVVAGSGDDSGLCTVFVHHTSASLILCENADPDVRVDLENWFAEHVRDGDPSYRHDAEGPDDMPSHIRSVLTQTSLAMPIERGHLDLGTWQGLYLWEHRHAPHNRRLSVVIVSA